MAVTRSVQTCVLLRPCVLIIPGRRYLLQLQRDGDDPPRVEHLTKSRWRSNIFQAPKVKGWEGKPGVSQHGIVSLWQTLSRIPSAGARLNLCNAPTTNTKVRADTWDNGTSGAFYTGWHDMLVHLACYFQRVLRRANVRGLNSDIELKPGTSRQTHRHARAGAATTRSRKAVCGNAWCPFPATGKKISWPHIFFVRTCLVLWQH